MLLQRREGRCQEQGEEEDGALLLAGSAATVACMPGAMRADDGAADQQSLGRQTIRLAEVIPARSAATAAEWRRAMGLVDLRKHAAYAATMRSRKTASKVAHLIEAVEWVPDDEEIEAVHIYTDGAAVLTAGWPKVARAAAWGAVVMVPRAGGHAQCPAMALVGAAFAPLAMMPPDFAPPTSPAAELLAIAYVSCMWATNLPEVTATAVLWADCEYALGVASGSARAHAHAELATSAREWAAALRCTAALDMQKVAAHRGYIGNEMADVAASLAIVGHVAVPTGCATMCGGVAERPARPMQRAPPRQRGSGGAYFARGGQVGVLVRSRAARQDAACGR